MKILPQGCQAKIIERFLKGDALREFTQNYHEAKLRTGSTKPTDRHWELAELAQKIGMHETAKKKKVSVGTVDYAVKRIGAWQWLGKDK